MWKLGRRIQANRERLGMKQEELAELAELSVNYISAIERGVKCPSLDAFVRIANALEVLPLLCRFLLFWPIFIQMDCRAAQVLFLFCLFPKIFSVRPYLLS